MTHARRIAAFAGALMLAGCGGGSTPAAPAGAVTPSSSVPLAVARLVIKYPANFHKAKITTAAAVRKASAKRTPTYVNPLGYNIDLYVDGVDQTPGQVTNSTSSPDGSQTFSLPLYSTSAHQIVSMETDSQSGVILSIGEADLSAGSFQPGDSPIIGLTMLMNVTAIGLMKTPNDIDASASIGSSFPGNSCTPYAFTVFPFAADETGGFVTTATNGTGLGTVIPYITGWSNDVGSLPANTLAAASGGLSTAYTITFNSALSGGVTLNLAAVNPASAIANDALASGGAYPGIDALSSGLPLSTINTNTIFTKQIDVPPNSGC